MKVVLLASLLICLNVVLLHAEQEHKFTDDRETNPLVIQKLEQWQDARFGLLMHWGSYSVEGLCESWPICSEPWITRDMDNRQEFIKWYEDLRKRFNPVDFDPENWAKLAKAAGMKYVVFTTKHHDGFAMYDTKYTDYKITDPSCPFSTNPRANVAREIFNAFRAKDFMIGAYFSKPDWHHDAYWSPYWATPDRHCNYDPEEYPELWQDFRKFTYGQVEELVRDYGPLDILWFDGSWVAPVSPMENVQHGGKLKNQDLKMDSLVAMARSYQEDLIIVDRWVHGRHENYLTPERKIPEEPLNGPWETCMPMAGAWSYYPDDVYKPTRELLRQLTNVISKGGNYLLNIGIDDKGNMPSDAVDRLEELADWMKVNNEAIHNTRAIAPYTDGKCRFTKGQDGSLYAIYVSDKNENKPPTHILLESQNFGIGTIVKLLGNPKPLKWNSVGNGTLIEIPEMIINNPPCDYAWVLKVMKETD